MILTIKYPFIKLYTDKKQKKPKKNITQIQNQIEASTSTKRNIIFLNQYYHCNGSDKIAAFKVGGIKITGQPRLVLAIFSKRIGGKNQMQIRRV